MAHAEYGTDIDEDGRPKTHFLELIAHWYLDLGTAEIISAAADRVVDEARDPLDLFAGGGT